jgi:hypothetical protein
VAISIIDGGEFIHYQFEFNGRELPRRTIVLRHLCATAPPASRLLLEICNDGGRMVDFGSAAHGDYFSITDSYDPLSNRRAFYDTSYTLPAAMVESYVAKWLTSSMQNFLYMLRRGMRGWVTLMQDTTA